MSDLISRLEGAERGSREFDALVSVALRLDCERNLPDDLQYLKAIRKDDYCAEGTYWYVCRSGMSLRTSEPVTTSLDAALALAERVIEDRGPININICLAGSAQVMIDHIDPCGFPLALAVAPAPALALCVAIMKAVRHVD